VLIVQCLIQVETYVGSSSGIRLYVLAVWAPETT